MGFVRILRTSAVTCLALAAFAVPLLGQQTFKIVIDSAEYYTDIPTELGRQLKFQASGNRLVVFDYENFRIMFYQRGSGIDDNTPITAVGKLDQVDDTQDFNPGTQDRLGSEFTGVIHNDTLWVTNYNRGEILLFDLDGNFLSSFEGTYRMLISYGDSLFAVQEDSIYLHLEGTTSFTGIARIPQGVTIQYERYYKILKVGSNRLIVRKDTTLFVYDAGAYLGGSTTDSLFTLDEQAIPDFEILPDKIVWATEYGTAFAYSDLNGGNRVDTTTGVYTYSFDFTDGDLFVLGSWGMRITDGSFTLKATSSRYPFYVDLRMLGVDDTSLYFYDFRNGGLDVLPLNYQDNTYFYRPDSNEIPYSGWYRTMRHGLDNKKFLLSEWPVDECYIYVFDIDSMKATSFQVPFSYGMDCDGDTIYVFSGKDMTLYLPTGFQMAHFFLSGHEGTSLALIDSSTVVSFAVNGQNVFVGYEDSVYVFSHNAILDTVFYMNHHPTTKFFATDLHLISNYPRQALEIQNGLVNPYADGANSWGFVYGERYWFESGENEYSYIVGTLVSVDEQTAPLPEVYSLDQNFPNPFNPSTSIRFTLPSASKVRLDVYNIVGQRIATLVNEQIGAGTYQYQFDARGMASGIYFYTLTAEGYTQTKKMVLLK